MKALGNILCLETSVGVCSVCIARGGDIIALKEDLGINNHSARLHLIIEEVMAAAGLTFDSLDAVAVSGGPGSYTGLRIGVSAAKGICYAADIPLISINTLQSMASLMLQHNKETKHSLILKPVIDARRMEVYSADYNTDLNQIRTVRAEIIDSHSLDYLSKNNIIVLAGNGAEKLKSLFGNDPRVVFSESNVHSATGMVRLANAKFAAADFEDVAYYEPFYFKEFVPGKPRVKGLE